MKIIGRFPLFLFLSVLISNCTNPLSELQQAESLIESKPDSALYILRHLSPKKYKSDESKALYGLLMTEALDRLKLCCPIQCLTFRRIIIRNTPILYA